jgi:hypothetical protein
VFFCGKVQDSEHEWGAVILTSAKVLQFVGFSPSKLNEMRLEFEHISTPYQAYFDDILGKVRQLCDVNTEALI